MLAIIYMALVTDCFISENSSISNKVVFDFPGSRFSRFVIPELVENPDAVFGACRAVALAKAGFR
jgi:hypothetical protein